ncbi:MAG: hypothetical protein JNJ63_10855 [Hyphomonadaceae bacterium]|nr:hypothetical protein [Hyphomonadaceae bacterium]
MFGTGRSAHKRFAPVWALLALVAISVRALVPAGYMLAPSAQAGGMAVTICTAQGAVDVVLDPAGGEHKQKNDSQQRSADAPCVFAGAAPLAAPDAAIALAAPALPSAPVDYVFAALAPGRGLAAPPPPSTGPPILI